MLVGKANHIKSFVLGHPPASWKYFLIYLMNFEYCLQLKEEEEKNIQLWLIIFIFLF